MLYDIILEWSKILNVQVIAPSGWASETEVLCRSFVKGWDK
jgi:hypothetical protein